MLPLCIFTTRLGSLHHTAKWQPESIFYNKIRFIFSINKFLA